MADIPENAFVDWDERCPDCNGTDFEGGPRGGLCQNVTCTTCGTRLNVLRWRDVLVMAHRIGEISR